MNPAASTFRVFHVWFSTKGRKPVLVDEVAEVVKENLASVAGRLRIRLIQMEAIEDHVHLLIELSDGHSLSIVMHDLKGASARDVFRRFPELPLDMRSHSLWQKGYGWRLVPAEQLDAVKRYIATQSERPLRHE